MHRLKQIALVPVVILALLAIGVPAHGTASTSTGSTSTGASPDSDGSGAEVQQTDRPLLQLGDRGPAVAAWQRQINILTNSDTAVDGIFGTSTEQATINFQTFFGLRVDGIVGENTRSVMWFLLAFARQYTPLELYSDFEVVGYTSEGGYCFEVRSGDDWNVECTPIPGFTIAAQGIELNGTRQVLVGSAVPNVARVVVETDTGAVVDADVHRDVVGIENILWTTEIDPRDTRVITALDATGFELGQIVVDNGDFIRILERGDVGPAVAVWQGQLNELAGLGLTEDGVFGENTVQATRNFQAFFGLTVDGVVGPETRGVMDFLLITQAS